LVRRWSKAIATALRIFDYAISVMVMGFDISVLELATSVIAKIGFL